MWIDNTIQADGAEYLRQRQGARDDVLLLVYPQVSDDFTERMFREYAGDSIVVAGIQNGNRFTAFSNETVADWVHRELHSKKFNKVAQIPLPSFAGKDDALFIFQRVESRLS